MLHKKLFLILIMFQVSYATTIRQYVSYLHNLSENQKAVMLKTFTKAKAFDLEYTMTAIAWQESQFGKFKINLSDPSFGVFHNLINSVARRHKTKSQWSKSRLAERLIYDFDFSFAEALAELEFWKNYHSSKSRYKLWSKMVASYNGGYNYKSKQAQQYLKTIKKRIKALRIYFKEMGYDR